MSLTSSVSPSKIKFGEWAPKRVLPLCTSSPSVSIAVAAAGDWWRRRCGHPHVLTDPASQVSKLSHCCPRLADLGTFSFLWVTPSAFQQVTCVTSPSHCLVSSQGHLLRTEETNIIFITEDCFIVAQLTMDTLSKTRAQTPPSPRTRRHKHKHQVMTPDAVQNRKNRAPMCSCCCSWRSSRSFVVSPMSACSSAETAEFLFKKIFRLRILHLVKKCLNQSPSYFSNSARHAVLAIRCWMESNATRNTLEFHFALQCGDISLTLD